MVASCGDRKRGPDACAEPGWELVAEWGGREWEPPPLPPSPPPPELTAGTEMQVGPEPEPPLFESLFSLRDPASAPARSPGWEKAWVARVRTGARPRRGQQAGWSPGDCGPGEWAGKGCQGSRVGSEGTAPGPEGP